MAAARVTHRADAPFLTFGLLVAGVALCIAAVGLGALWPVALGAVCIAAGAWLLAWSAILVPAAIERATTALALSGTERVLDAGCGSGRWMAALAPQVATVVGIDRFAPAGRRDPGSATVAHRNLTLLGIAERCELIDSDPSHLPFPDATFDAITHVRGPGRPTTRGDELRRVARAGAPIVEIRPRSPLLLWPVVVRLDTDT